MARTPRLRIIEGSGGSQAAGTPDTADSHEQFVDDSFFTNVSTDESDLFGDAAVSSTAPQRPLNAPKPAISTAPSGPAAPRKGASQGDKVAPQPPRHPEDAPRTSPASTDSSLPPWMQPITKSTSVFAEAPSKNSMPASLLPPSRSGLAGDPTGQAPVQEASSDRHRPADTVEAPLFPAGSAAPADPVIEASPQIELSANVKRSAPEPTPPGPRNEIVTLPAIDEPSLMVLRHLLGAGGRIEAKWVAGSTLGYVYGPRDWPDDDQQALHQELESLASKQLLERFLHDRIAHCPSCDSHRLEKTDVCPDCRSIEIDAETKLQTFWNDGGDIGKVYQCRNCQAKFETPVTHVSCLACGDLPPMDRLKVVEIYDYEVTALGRQAVRAAQSRSGRPGT